VVKTVNTTNIYELPAVAVDIKFYIHIHMYRFYVDILGYIYIHTYMSPSTKRSCLLL